MFGLDKNNGLKFSIVETLETAGQAVTSTALHDQLGFSTLTVLTACKELQDDFTRIYPHGEVHINIEKNGIELERHDSSLQFFFDDLLSSDASYTIIRELFVNRKIPTDELGVSQALSQSTLRRKIGDVNKIFEDYNLHISVSNITSLTGNEGDIRYMFYAFLSGIHKQFSRVPWIDNKDYYLKIAHDILEYLSLESYTYNTDSTAFWVYIQLIARDYAETPLLTEEQELLLEDFNFPDKPDFLEDWTEDEWNFFFVSIYTSGKYDISLLYPKSFEDRFETVADYWIKCFEEAFMSLTRRGKKKATQKVYQQILTSQFYSLNGDMISMLNVFDIDTFAGYYPSYAGLFENFWETYSETTDYKPITTPYFKVMSLLLAVTICPIRSILPEIDIFLFSNQNHLTQTYLKQRLSHLLSNNFNIVFLDNPMNVDIILSAVPVPRDFKNFNTTTLLIRVPFKQNDLDELIAVANKIATKAE